jgi:hypothetical protein
MLPHTLMLVLPHDISRAAFADMLRMLPHTFMLVLPHTEVRCGGTAADTVVVRFVKLVQTHADAC